MHRPGPLDRRTARTGRGGYAMALMLLVLLTVATITITVVGTSVRDQEASRVGAARAEARLIAVSALEEFYARVVRDPTLPAAAVAGTAQVPGLRTVAAADGWVKAPMPDSRLDGRPAPAAYGTEACPTGEEAYRWDCYYLTVSDPVGQRANPASVTVTVTVRVRCGGRVERCILARFEQRLRRTQFFDFVLSYERTTIAPDALFASGSTAPGAANAAAADRYRQRCDVRADRRSGVVFTDTDVPVQPGTSKAATGSFTPSGSASPALGCIDVAFQSASGGGDVVDGPVYTADDFLTVCARTGAPVDFTRVYVSGAGWDGSAFRPAGGPCTVAVDAVARLQAPLLAQPGSADVIAEALASAQVAVLTKDKGDVPVVLTFKPDGVKVTGASGSVPAAYGAGAGTVIVVRVPVASSGSAVGSVDVHLSGEVRGLVSVVVEGSAAIVDDLFYANGGCGTKPTDACRTTGNVTDALSVTATDRIEIWQTCGTSTASDACTKPVKDPADPVDPAPMSSSPPDRVVHAILTSPQGYIGVPDWSSNVEATTARTPARLRLFGSVASRFQGVFGAYDTDTGDLVGGYVKAFVHDDRLSRYVNAASPTGTLPGLPPFIVTSNVPVWTRLDVAEVAAG